MNGTPPIMGTSMLPPKKGNGWKIYAIIATILLVGSLFANLVLVMVAAASLFSGLGEQMKPHPLMETVTGGDEKARDKIAIIDVYGIVSSGGRRHGGMVEDVSRRLDQALKDENVKAIVLKIDSPGGEVTASDTLYQKIKAASTKKPVIAYINTVGASGAYYLSMGATKVIAYETSITGSIGVIMQSINFAGLMDKVGVESITFKSGKNKDLMNPFKKATAEELKEQSEIIESLIKEVYDRFLGIVANERNLDKEQLRAGLADGRIVSGLQAKAAGLVDDVGSFESAVNVAKQLARITAARTVKYEEPFSLRDIFSFGLMQGRTPLVQVNLVPQDFQLEPGKLYYLSHHLGF